MMRGFVLVLLLVLAPKSADCTVLRPGEIGVFYDRAATQRIGTTAIFLPFYVCARLDAAGLSAARYRLEAWTPEGYTATIAMPCATQNELDEAEAEALIKNGVRVVCEGANMPATVAAIRRFKEAKVLHVPGKASNAGGVGVSGLEMTQNSMRMSWSSERVDQELRAIMKNIHQRCVEHSPVGEHVNYVDGANIAGFKKVAAALYAYGVV